MVLLVVLVCIEPHICSEYSQICIETQIHMYYKTNMDSIQTNTNH